MFKYTEYVRYSLTAENKLATLPCRDIIQHWMPEGHFMALTVVYQLLLRLKYRLFLKVLIFHHHTTVEQCGRHFIVITVCRYIEFRA